ncbi:leucine-rich repeat protein [Treponema sp.]|uniref:leucine-rich repeat protein n=1 Tax=Treponema sp. TaxID=166 RepID=UPI00388FBF4D
MKKISTQFQIENNVLIWCKTDARKVVIPEGVTEIGIHAFDLHTNMVSVTIPKTVKKIGKKAFLDVD